ncbi:unnamed protein product [Pylaiella littoralis]
MSAADEDDRHRSCLPFKRYDAPALLLVPFHHLQRQRELLLLRHHLFLINDIYSLSSCESVLVVRGIQNLRFFSGETCVKTTTERTQRVFFCKYSSRGPERRSFTAEEFEILRLLKMYLLINMNRRQG